MSLFAVALTICIAPVQQTDGSLKDACETYIVEVDDSYTSRRRCINHGLRPLGAKLESIATAPGGLEVILQQYGSTIDSANVSELFLTCRPVEKA